MTSLELKILKLAQGWAKAQEGQKYPIWDGSCSWRYPMNEAYKLCGEELLKLFPASRVKSVG